MKKFTVKIIVLSLPLVILMFIADYYISEKVKNNHESPGEIEVWNDIYNGEIKANVAIYGSSRAWVHINPTILEDSLNTKAYNFGIDGHNFWLQYLRNKEYLKYNKPPKVIIVSVDVFSLAKRKDLYQFSQFLPYMLWNKDIKKFTSSYNGFSLEDYYLPLFRYYGSMRGSGSVIKPPSNKSLYRNKGYRGMERKWNNDLAKAKLEKKHYSINIDANTVYLFNQFLLESKSSEITVILVYTPEYIDGQNFVKNREEIVKIYEDLSNKHNLLFLDYSDDILCKQKEYFYNASHLNKKGSEIFTRKLARDLKARTHNTVYN
jgi:hypothetical protein